jgi:predicted ATP-grasp superfamily ATP-dependent carboligase
MLKAITIDLAQIADVVVALDPRFEIELDHAEVVPTHPDQALFGQWIRAARDCDAALIVAPENDGVLAKAVGMLRAGGVDVIAGNGDFLRVASDKLQTAKALRAAGVAHPPFLATSDNRYESDLEGLQKFVLKPRDGCGTQAIKIFDSLAKAKTELTEAGLIQPWIAGTPVSIALVASGSNQTFLPAVQQQICSKTCGYAGGCGPLDDDAQRRATALAAHALSVIPPARGFVGLDLILGEEPSEDVVIEINPRLTTSYVGLRKMISGNLAARLFDLETGPVACSHAVDSVRWTPDGQVWINDTLVNETVADHA